ncbi:cystatin-1-like [Engystomops pustulosus]|uniref:cystatin-1-like n=1 Tax=Engystomops pustulosus TaxID=76066 RepID=UPI003AFA602A
MKLFILFFALVSISFCAAEEWIVPKIVTTTGGWNALPLNSKKVIDMVKLLQDTYNKESKSLYWSKITKVEEATMQVTNGFNYHFAVIVEPTGCLKQKDFKTCNLKTLTMVEPVLIIPSNMPH